MGSSKITTLGSKRNRARDGDGLLTAAGKAFDLLIDRNHVDLQATSRIARASRCMARAIDENPGSGAASGRGKCSG